jgi:hypothetical protein
MSKNYLYVINTTDKNRWNCVLFARSLVKKLPFGLWTISDKKKIINSHKAQHGSIAIIKTGFIWGHVAYVESVGKNHITITEANFRAGKITERHGTEKDLKILGYFQP